MASLATRVSDLATRMATECKSIRTLLNGNAANLSSLSTTAKNNLVAAVNEVLGIANAKQTALGFTPENSANKGQANGYAGLDGTGKVPASQLPAFVDDVLEYNGSGTFPATGVGGIIYIDTSVTPATQYRWTGSAYQQMISSPGSTDAVPEGAVNKYFTDARAQSALSASLGNTDTDFVAVFNTGLV